MKNAFLSALVRATRHARKGRFLKAGKSMKAAIVAGNRAVKAVSTLYAPAKPVGRKRKRPLGSASGRKRSPVPGVAPARRRVAKSTFEASMQTHGGLTRTYKLFVPSRVGPAPALVVMLHGCSQDPDDFAAGTRMNQLAEAERFLVLYPAQTRTANASGCWNWYRRDDQCRGSGEAGFLSALTRSIATEHKVDPNRIFVAGLSAGAAMATILATEYPELFAAVGVHSGVAAGAASNAIDAITAMRRGRARRATADRVAARTEAKAGVVPTIVFHAEHDRTVHPANGDEVVASVLRNLTAMSPSPATHTGFSSKGQRYTKVTHHHVDGSSLVEQWVLRSAAHGWSGGDPKGSYTDPAGVDASSEMWRFFETERSLKSRHGDAS